jgi:hypothetical protein
MVVCTCCSSGAFEGPNENTFALTLPFFRYVAMLLCGPRVPMSQVTALRASYHGDDDRIRKARAMTRDECTCPASCRSKQALGVGSQAAIAPPHRVPSYIGNAPFACVQRCLPPPSPLHDDVTCNPAVLNATAALQAARHRLKDAQGRAFSVEREAVLRSAMRLTRSFGGPGIGVAQWGVHRLAEASSCDGSGDGAGGWARLWHIENLLDAW